VRVVLQRVDRAHVDVVDPTTTHGPGQVRRVGELSGPGLVALVGVAHEDGQAQVDWMADKVSGLRVMRNERSVVDAGTGVLLVSQFTVLGDVRKGRRPTWAAAAPGPVAEPLVQGLADALRRRGVPVPTGSFGADMRVHLVNDGPVTLVIDTP